MVTHGRAGVGLALGPRRMVAVTGQVTWSRELGSDDAGTPDPAELARRLDELRRELGSSDSRLRVALLPPLVVHRRLELPRARECEIRRVVAAAAGKYFADAAAPQTVAVVAETEARVSPRGYWVTSASESLVERVLVAAGDAGWHRTTVASAYAAWQSAALRRWPALASGIAAVLIPDEACTDVLVFGSGRVRVARRFPGSWSGSEIAQRLDVRRIAVLGSEPECAALSGSLRAAGMELLTEAPGAPLMSRDALAARFARDGDAELVPDPLRQLRAARARRTSLRFYGAAAALFLLTLGLELWGVQRELDHVRMARASRQDRVAQALALRDGIADVESRVDAIRRAEVRASRWGPVLAGIAAHLPGDAYLVGFSGSQDSLRLDGRAARAANVFESLQRAPLIAGVRADALIRQEPRDSGPPVEHFSAAARAVVSGTRP